MQTIHKPRSPSATAPMAYFIVHRSAAGWINSDPGRIFDTESEARADIPRIAALLKRPMATFAITDVRAARHQFH